jgi:hypothetical protein
MTGPKTYAAWPVWRDSTTEPVTWQAMPKKAAVKLWHRARDFERRTRQPGQQDGALGRNGLAVLQTLIFDFLNFRTGRLDPGRPKIAKLAGISESSVQRGLVKLKAAGVLNWLRRCSGAMEDGRFILKQDTNAYAILPASQWRGYTLPPEPPEPHPATWGACPPLPDAVTAAAAERREGGSMADMLRHLESDPGDGLAAVLARLGRTMQGSKNP